MEPAKRADDASHRAGDSLRNSALWLWQLSGARAVAAAIFVVASITDYADGALARKQGLVTTFGKVADPLADKALTGVALIGLSYLNELPWWVTIVILVREIGVTLLRFWSSDSE